MVQMKCWRCLRFDSIHFSLSCFWSELSENVKKGPFMCAVISPPDHLPPPAVLVCLNVTLEYREKSITKLSILPPYSYLTLSTAPAPVLGTICRMNLFCPVKRWNRRFRMLLQRWMLSSSYIPVKWSEKKSVCLFTTDCIIS